MDLGYQCHTHMEEGRNYVMLHKFLISAIKELQGAKHIKLHKNNLLQDTSSYDRARRSQRYFELQISSIEAM